MKKSKLSTHRAKSMILAIAAIAFLAIIGITSLTTTAHAENITNPYQQYYYNYAHPGTVICTQLTVRTDPSTTASEYGKLKNGQSCSILGQYGEWYIIDLASCNYKDHPTGYGFAKEALIKQDPYWIVLTQYTYMYTTPWQKANKRNGEQSGRVCLVIEEEYPFYAIQCREYTAGTSFVFQWDVGQYSKAGQNLYVCVEDSIPIYDSPWGQQIKTVDKFTIVDVDSVSGIYSHIVVNAGTAKEFSGWIQSQYIQKIIN